MLRPRLTHGLGLTITLALVATVPAVPRALHQSAPPASAAPAIPVEVVALDRNGRVPDNLSASSFAVTVDGKPRRVLWVRYVLRGPGSAGEAAQRLPGHAEGVSVAAEPARIVLVVVDEASLQRGSERTVLQAATQLVDRLGLDDRIAVVRIPMARDSRVTLTTVRPEVREALRFVVGQVPLPGAPANASPDAQAADPNRVVADPNQAVGVDRERPPAEIAASARPGEDAAGPAVLENLRAVLAALQPTPGRKIVALFSGGLPATAASRLDEVAAAATAAHAVVHAFGLPGLHDDLAGAPDLGALDRLAKATGGSYTLLGRNLERSVERVVAELGACYVLGIESAASDTDGRRHALRVEAPNLPLTLRAAAWLVPREDLADLVPGAQHGAAEPGQAPAAAPADPSAAAPAAGRTVIPFARDAEVQRVLARAADYVAGYQREYSLLVAEEDYVQTTRSERQHLRSDLLLVRKPGEDGWVSFRDVYEVNGSLVRDREDRLKRLFLDQSAEAQAQLRAIKDESARYNLGHRNINVPLFPLKFLEPDNLLHFEYKPAGRHEAGGVEGLRIAFVEWARPTLVRYSNDWDVVASDSQLRDLPATGWFLVDPVSGAILGTRMQLTYDPDRVIYEIEVRYQRDASLGLWVPAEMRETYSVGRAGSMDKAVTLQAQATYSKFRRFQVRTEEQIKIPK